MELNNKKVMVVGTGISGIGAIDLLNKACLLYTSHMIVYFTGII